MAVGSVKSMIGHTKTVAGLASVIKTALALKHRVLPPTIGIDKPSTPRRFGQQPVLSQHRNAALDGEPSGEHPRRAGVSSFGFGGTNFHVVLEEYTGDYHPSSELDWTPRSAEVFVFQRASREEIVSALRRFEQQLADAVTEDLAGLRLRCIRRGEQSVGCRRLSAASPSSPTPSRTCARRFARPLDASAGSSRGE